MFFKPSYSAEKGRRLAPPPKTAPPPPPPRQGDPETRKEIKKTLLAQIGLFSDWNLHYGQTEPDCARENAKVIVALAESLKQNGLM